MVVPVHIHNPEHPKPEKLNPEALTTAKPSNSQCIQVRIVSLELVRPDGEATAPPKASALRPEPYGTTLVSNLGSKRLSKLIRVYSPSLHDHEHPEVFRLGQ